MARGETFSGFHSFSQEDTAVIMSAGALKDRTYENLCPADMAIVRLYKTLLDVAKAGEADADPVGLHVNPEAVVGTQGNVPPEGWQAMVPGNRPRAKAARANAEIAGSAAAAEALAASGLAVAGIDTDAAEWESVEAMAAAALVRFGRIDVLVNNAAIASSMALTPFEQVDSAAFMRMLAVNTLGTFNGCKAVSPAMRARKAGAIINLASGTALRGMPFVTPYVASKGAVITITRSLAHELGSDGITVNAVSPGYTLTRSNLDNEAYMAEVRPSVVALRALKRDAYTEYIVGTIAFLAGPDARFITGQIIAVDGGATYQ